MNIITIPGGNVLPAMLKTQMKYTSRLTLSYDAGTTLSSVLNLKANSPHDPLGSSGTEQPQFFDQMMIYYSYFQVTACRIRITVSNPTSIYYYIYTVPTTDTTQTFTMERASGMPGCKKMLVTPDNQSGETTLYNYRTTPTVYGMETAESALLGTGTTDPVALWYWHTSVAGAQVDGQTSFTALLLVELTYYVVFSTPKVVGFS